VTLVLGIETSCDETAAAVVEDGLYMRSNIIASQVDLHAQYGGVFPEVAARAHVEAISLIVQQALDTAQVALDDLDLIAVTRGPGLAGSLLVGVNFGKGLAMARGLPLVGVNHLEGHLYSLWLTEPERPIRFPVVNLIVSGGHTELILMTAHGVYERLGGTIDDAAGEAFDKVGRLLGLPYPGGPSIQKAAESGSPQAYDFPRALQDGSFDFSFSGLKTSVMRAVRPPHSGKRLAGEESLRPGELRAGISIPDVAASFQAAVVEVLVQKTIQAAVAYHVTEILISGGVSANRPLREQMRAQSPAPVRYPPLPLCTDNGAMIAAAGYYRYLAGQRDDLALDILPTWPLTDLTRQTSVRNVSI
jgi:N6-L-threonylcarbamoyladenine synthase